MVDDRPDTLGSPEQSQRARTRASLDAHLDRLDREQPRLAGVAGVRRLRDDDVMAFVLDARADGMPGPDYTSADLCRFGELDVIVSSHARQETEGSRIVLPDGYFNYLDRVLRDFRRGLGERDTAHWIFARGGVHLAYFPARHVDALRLFPVDLLNDDDRRILS